MGLEPIDRRDAPSPLVKAIDSVTAPLFLSPDRNPFSLEGFSRSLRRHVADRVAQKQEDAEVEFEGITSSGIGIRANVWDYVSSVARTLYTRLPGTMQLTTAAVIAGAVAYASPRFFGMVYTDGATMLGLVKPILGIAIGAGVLLDFIGGPKRS